jgi:hypothetical protein
VNDLERGIAMRWRESPGGQGKPMRAGTDDRNPLGADRFSRLASPIAPYIKRLPDQ